MNECKRKSKGYGNEDRSASKLALSDITNQMKNPTRRGPSENLTKTCGVDDYDVPSVIGMEGVRNVPNVSHYDKIKNASGMFVTPYFFGIIQNCCHLLD